MMSFRGFQWIYDVTEVDEKTRARAASFVHHLQDAERLKGHQRVTRRQSPTTPERDVSICALAPSASVRRRRTASDPFLVTTLGNSSASLDPELSDSHGALRAQKGVMVNNHDDWIAPQHVSRKEVV